MERRPNILYIFTDQQSATAMSCAGNPHLRTPCLDRIASQGVRFDCAYTSFPLCVPARTSMFTGRMAHECGVVDNRPTHDTGLPFDMLGRLLADNGYDCHYVGKWHIPSVAETDAASHGFGQVVFGGGYGGLDTEKTDAAIAFLERPHGSPFFLVVSYNNPHDCCELSRREPLRMGPIPDPPDVDKLPPLPFSARIPEGEPDAIRTFQDEIPFLLANDWDAQRTREYLWGYYRLTEMVDAEIGRVLAALETTGRQKDTLVVFSSDHGDGHGCHRWNQKWTFYDESSGVPFVVVPPGHGQGGTTISCPVSATLDLMPTILDYAAIGAVPECRGISIRPLIEGQSLQREYVAAETDLSEPGTVPGGPRRPGRMIRTERYKYSAFQAGSRREQLVDMRSDPGEMSNLAGTASHAAVLRRHRDMLTEWCRVTDDSFDLATAIEADPET